ncbi:hypothetical protein CLG96_01280 [Sphingomonas oleivorans]|uniref:YdhG-like domain-containing protein n=1 Tax=Sphingomonas oleivorans TaxID=1735121 RepID=A0A2T5G0Y4_9SPHN|nr:YdeI/OmpD-associated family protein [Sphingomonas oleivorans]PTQ12808.1 hypothetical protein CLG96_01280 [Sphingomonas oleivorans]
MSRDPRVDAYIEKAQPFARPILSHLREAVHGACPEAEEAIKWNSPFFLYRGQILCMMAGFKEHAIFGFWRGAEVTGEGGAEKGGMGQFGRIMSLGDLPDPATLTDLIRKAAAIIATGEKRPRPLKHPKPPLETPEDLAAALIANPPAQASFDGFSPSQRREYVEWVIEAKRPETRARRIAQAVEWMAEGKQRNWKYQNC